MTEVLAIEDLAADAMTAKIDPRRPPNTNHLLEQAGRWPIQRKPVMRCPLCQGRGIDSSKWAWAWGFWCWGCAGWGVVDPDNIYLKGPSGPHPFREGL